MGRDTPNGLGLVALLWPHLTAWGIIGLSAKGVRVERFLPTSVPFYVPYAKPVICSRVQRGLGVCRRRTACRRGKLRVSGTPFGARKTGPSAYEPLMSSGAVAEVPLADLFFGVHSRAAHARQVVGLIQPGRLLLLPAG